MGDTRSSSCFSKCLSQCSVDAFRRMFCCCSRNKIEHGDSERENAAKNIEMIGFKAYNSESKMCNRTTEPDTTVFCTNGSRCAYNNQLEDGKDKIVSIPIPRGLRNNGNTCYFNSMIQPLCHTHILYGELQLANRAEIMSRSFRDLCCELQNGKSKPFNPNTMRNQFIKIVPRFKKYRQHDSHECLRHFLEEMRKEERAASTNLLTAVDKIFGGHLATVYICKQCDKHSHLFEPCLDISLPVFIDASNEVDSFSNARRLYEREKNCYKRSVANLATPLSSKSSSSYYLNKNTISLDDCLTHFSRVEQINEEYLCEDCLRKAMARGEADEDNLKLTSATKQTLIFNPPAILTIHFKRFELLPGKSRKRSDMVEYPEYLDIAPYCSSQCLRNDPPRNNIWYSLYAVVVHSGSLGGGHYVAYVKAREREKNVDNLKKFLQEKYFNHNVTSNELMNIVKPGRPLPFRKTDTERPKRDGSKWFLMNDGSVREVNVEEVLRQEAYLLFYERIDGKDGVDHETFSNMKNSDENTFVETQYIGDFSKFSYRKSRYETYDFTTHL